MVEEVLKWLEQALPAQKITVDRLSSVNGSWGLFPLGQEILRYRQTITGDVTRNIRGSFLLRHTAADPVAAQLALEQLCQKANACQDLRAEQARMEKADLNGTKVYQVKLYMTKTVKENDHGEN